MPRKEGSAKRLKDFLDTHSQMPGIDLLRNIVNYGTTTRGFDADEWVHELVDGTIGDNYPMPDRMLVHVEQVVHDYLLQELCNGKEISGNFNLFAVEGATAAMCYIFDSLIENFLLSPGDTIAIMVPIFPPYLEIPQLARYDFNVVEIKAGQRRFPRESPPRRDAIPSRQSIWNTNKHRWYCTANPPSRIGSSRQKCCKHHLR